MKWKWTDALKSRWSSAYLAVASLLLQRCLVLELVVPQFQKLFEHFHSNNKKNIPYMQWREAHRTLSLPFLQRRLQSHRISEARLIWYYEKYRYVRSISISFAIPLRFCVFQRLIIISSETNKDGSGVTIILAPRVAGFHCWIKPAFNIDSIGIDDNITSIDLEYAGEFDRTCGFSCKSNKKCSFAHAAIACRKKTWKENSFCQEGDPLKIKTT